MDHSNESHEEAHPKGLAATTDVNMTEAPVTWKAYLLCAFASFGGIFFGYDSGYINGVLNSPLFIEEVQGPVCPQGLATPGGACAISSNNTSLIVSILSAGTFFGALAAGDIADIYGRKWTIVAGCMIYIIGVILQMAANGRDLLVAGRAIAGIGVGFESAIVILYMSEICPKKVRGALVSGYQFCITIGLLLAACVNYSVQDRNDTGQYRIPIGIQFAWGIILAGGIACLPDSPRYFIKRGKTVEAKKALMKVRGVHPSKPDAEHLRAMVEFELAEIIANEEYEREQTPAGGWLAGWTNCFKGSLFQSNSNLRKTILGTSLQMMQQWTGVNFIFYYSTPFLESTGAIKNTFLISLIFTLVNVCSTPLSFYGMEKFGRRTLLLYGAFGMLICQFLVAIIGVTVGFNKSITLEDGTTRAQNLSAVNAQIAFIAIFIFFFATTWGPGAWVLIGEVFPLPIRSRGVALSTASNWLWNTIIAVITPYMVGKKEGNLRSSVFFIWGGLCTTAFVYTYFLVPETKGLSLEQVDQMMAETSPRTSAKWRPTHTFAESSIAKGGAARLEGDQVIIDTEKVQRTASIH
jgi:sugar porter (SP) family MFS transporter